MKGISSENLKYLNVLLIEHMFDKLSPFFKGKSIAIREYSRLLKISPSTSKIYLEQMEKEGILKSRKDHNLVLFKGDGEKFTNLKIEYNIKRIKDSKLINYLEQFNPTAIILFGSQAKGTNNEKSDIDIAVVIPKQSKKLNLSFSLENQEVQFFVFTNETFRKNKELANNIVNGRILYGFLEVY